jgi:hypothetical protein
MGEEGSFEPLKIIPLAKLQFARLLGRIVTRLAVQWVTVEFEVGFGAGTLVVVILVRFA